VGRLARLRREMAAAGAAPDGGAAMTSVQDFGPNPGGLGMRTYIPADLPAGAPLVVVLHGCTQGAEAHAASAGWLTLADRCGFAVLAPEQSAANNPNRCFNWFEPQDTVRGKGEAASIHAMIQYCLHRHGLDRGRVFVTGLSAGGAMANVMLATYPEVFAGGAVVAGLPYGVAHGVQQAMSLMRGGQRTPVRALGDAIDGAAPRPAALPRIVVWHGDVDWTVTHANGEDVAHQWAAAHGVEASDSEALSGGVRRTWRSGAGEAVVELNLIRGLGHGTPLATTGAAGIGHPAPFMLEAGVSSTLETARFWGLSPALPRARSPARPEREAERAPKAAAKMGDGVMSAIGAHVHADVQAVIARALKSAGLMS